MIASPLATSSCPGQALALIIVTIRFLNCNNCSDEGFTASMASCSRERGADYVQMGSREGRKKSPFNRAPDKIIAGHFHRPLHPVHRVIPDKDESAIVAALARHSARPVGLVPTGAPFHLSGALFVRAPVNDFQPKRINDFENPAVAANSSFVGMDHDDCVEVCCPLPLSWQRPPPGLLFPLVLGKGHPLANDLPARLVIFNHRVLWGGIVILGGAGSLQG